MIKKRFVNWLHQYIPAERWEQVWWLAPTMIILSLPIGALALKILGLMGWSGVARPTQALMVISVLGGFLGGPLVLWSVEEANLKPKILTRVKWLAGVSIVAPFSILMLLFWIASIT